MKIFSKFDAPQKVSSRKPTQAKSAEGKSRKVEAEPKPARESLTATEIRERVELGSIKKMQPAMQEAAKEAVKEPAKELAKSVVVAGADKAPAAEAEAAAVPETPAKLDPAVTQEKLKKVLATKAFDFSDREKQVLEGILGNQ